MRLIDADALLLNIPETNVDIFENCRNCTTLTYEQVAEIIMAQRAIKDVPIKHGRWLDDGDTGWLCSECGHDTWELIGDCKPTKSGVVWTEKTPNYCPKCGARMDGE